MKKSLYIGMMASLLFVGSRLDAWMFTNHTGVRAKVLLYDSVGHLLDTTDGTRKHWKDVVRANDIPFGFDTSLNQGEFTFTRKAASAKKIVVVYAGTEPTLDMDYGLVMAQAIFDQEQNNLSFSLVRGNNPKTYVLKVHGKKYDKHGCAVK